MRIFEIVSDTSRKCIDREGLKRRRTGTRQVFVLFSVTNLHYNIDVSNDNSKALLRATRGVYNPYLQVVITHASHVCNQHSFGLPLRMNGMYRTQFDHARMDPLPFVKLIRRILTICHVKRTQSTALELPCDQAFFFFQNKKEIRTPDGRLRWSKSAWITDRCRPHSITFGYYQL